MFEKGSIVFKTDDYSLFRTLRGNREVNRSRIDKIEQSIKDVGYVSNPIIVNNKMEVIDGQGRLEALKRLGLPVEFIVVNGCGIRECIAMNINMTNWGLIDYIKSYANQGIDSYRRLLGLINAYRPIQEQLIIGISLGRLSCRSCDMNTVKNGLYKIGTEQLEKAQDELEFIKIIRKYSQKKAVSQAFLFCYRIPLCNKDRLLRIAETGAEKLDKCGKVIDILEVVESMYNKNLRLPAMVFFVSEYKKYSRNGFYNLEQDE